MLTVHTYMLTVTVFIAAAETVEEACFTSSYKLSWIYFALSFYQSQTLLEAFDLFSQGCSILHIGYNVQDNFKA